MTAESACRSELAQPVPHHILGNVDRYMAASVVNGNRMSHHLGENDARATPGADNLLLAALVHGFDFLEQFRVNEWTLFQ